MIYESRVRVVDHLRLLFAPLFFAGKYLFLGALLISADIVSHSSYGVILLAVLALALIGGAGFPFALYVSYCRHDHGAIVELTTKRIRIFRDGDLIDELYYDDVREVVRVEARAYWFKEMYLFYRFLLEDGRSVVLTSLIPIVGKLPPISTLSIQRRWIPLLENVNRTPLP